MGITPTSLGIAKDDAAELKSKIVEGMQCDFFFISGGVSTGDRDLVPGILEDTGYEIKFHKVKIKPGKPLVFGVAPGNKYVFGLPGNPVSTMVIFETIVKPAIRRFQGLDFDDTLVLEAQLSDSFKRKSAEREERVPVRLEWRDKQLVAYVIPYHGSGHFAAMTHANGLMRIPIGVDRLAQGDMVEVQKLDW